MLKDLKIRLVAGLAACACVFGACGFMVQSGFAVANADAVEESDNPSVTDVTAPFTQGSLGDSSTALRMTESGEGASGASGNTSSVTQGVTPSLQGEDKSGAGDSSQAQNDNGEEYSLEIVSKNVSYSDSIYMLYAVANDGFDRTQNQIQLLFWESEQTEYVIGTEKSSVTTLKSATLKGESCLVFYSHGIAAKEMNDLVYCRAYVEVNGVAVYSDVVKYSVVDYVYEMRANHTLTEKQTKMFTEMLDYGAAAQDLLGYRTDAFANATYYTVTVENGTLEDGFAYGRYAEKAEATLKADELGGGLTFSHWEDENGVNVGSTATQKVSITANKTYTAIYCDEFVYELSSGKDYYTITGYQGNGGAVTIPSTFMGLPVRAISVDVFAGNTNVQSVVIEEGIVTIGHRAFKGCTALTSVVVKSGVTTIGKQAFYGCSKLVSVTLPDTVSNIADEFTFYACPKLESITVDDDNAYYEDIDGNLYTKGGLTLIRYAVGKTATELVLPESVTEIAPSALRDSLNLTKVVLPKSVAKIGLYAFRNCPKLTIYAIADSAPEGWVADWKPDNCPVVWGYRLPTSANVFDYIIEDESVTITRYRGEDTEVIIPSIIEGKPVTKIDSLAFYDFPELESVEIPDCVTSIGSNAFTGTQLTSIELPNSLIELGDYAFPYSNFTYNEYNYGKYIGNEENPYMALVRGNSNGIIHEDTRFIVDEAFRNTGVSSVDIHENILSIGVGAFRECDNLRTMVIPDNVTHLGGWAISQCGNLTEVTIGTGITSIELCMFQYNYDMHTIHFRGDIKRIEHTSFFLCTSLTNLVLPTGLEYIGQNAFEYCGELKEIVIPASVEEIGNAAFHYTGLTKVVFENPENWMAFDWDSYDIIVNPIEIGSVANEETAALYLTDTYYNKIWRNTTSWFEYALNADGESYTLTKFLGAQRGTWVNDEREMTQVLVPATYQGLPVTAVSAYAFQENSDLQTIVFAEGITEIENYAIYNCSSLTSVVIPNSITNIGDSAFYQDYWWSGGIYNEYDNAYYWGNSSNPYLVLMEAKSIDITACEIHPSTKFIMGNAFESCAKLTSIIIPNGVTSIGGYAFSGCKGLTNITIPETLMRVGMYAFNGCDNLQYTEYDNAYYLGNEGNPYHVLLKGVSNDITSCEIHPDTKIIAGNALYFCQKISEIEIPNGVISIGYDAFYAYSLAKITIPISVSYIESGAFSGSYSSTIYCEAESEPSGWEKNWCAENTPVVWNYRENNVASDGCVYVYENGLRYALRDGEAVVVRQSSLLVTAEILTEILYNGETYPVTEIGIGAFISCYNLTTVTIPEGIVKISDYAFYYTDSLQDIIIPDSVTSIGNKAFSSMNYRKNFTTLVIGAGLEYIAEDAFYVANKYLTRIVVSEDNQAYTAIDGNLYTKDGKTLVLYAAGKSETEFVIPDGVTHIGDFVFTFADTLTKIILPESLVYAGRWSFNEIDCLLYNEYKGAYYIGMGDNPYYMLADVDYSVDILEIPESTKIIAADSLTYYISEIIVDKNNPYYQSIDGNLYTKDGKTLVKYACAKTATEFVILAGVESINEYAFNSCDSLEKIVVPSSVKSIGRWAFYSCSSLTSVVIPNGVTTIANSAFAWCTNMQSVEIPNSITSIEYEAFYNCSSLEFIVIPNSVAFVDSQAFSSCGNLKIACMASSKPSLWSKYWNYSNRPVVWGYKGA